MSYSYTSRSQGPKTYPPRRPNMDVANLREFMVPDQEQQLFRAREHERLRDESTEVFNLYQDSQVPLDLQALRINYDGVEFQANDALKRYGREYVDRETDPAGFFYGINEDFVCEEEKRMRKIREMYHSKNRNSTRMGEPLTNYERYWRNIDEADKYDNSHRERNSDMHVKPPGTYQAPPQYLDYVVAGLIADGSLYWNQRQQPFSEY